MPAIKTPDNISARWLLKTAIIFFVIAVIFCGSGFLFEKKYQNRIYPGIYAAEIDLSGKTAAEATAVINEKVDAINQNGITFYYDNKQAIIYPIISSTSGDIARRIIDLDAEQTVKQALFFGRSSDFFSDWREKLTIFFSKRSLLMAAHINEEEIKKELAGDFSQFDVPAEDAKLVYEIQLPNDSKESDFPPVFSVRAEKFGRVIDYQKGIEQMKKNLSFLSNAPVELITKTAYPRLYQKDCVNINNKAQEVLALAPLKLKVEKKEWTIDKKQLTDLLALAVAPDEEGNKIIVALNAEMIKNYLQNVIAPEINKKAAEAKFEIKNGRVTEFRPGNDGVELDIETSFNNIEKGVRERKNEIELILRQIKNSVVAENVNNLGIKEIVGIGQSNFTGSPANRRHNIRVGANTLNGILIKPGEEFSLLKALGEVDADAGYLPELVIKGDKTTPEYGGGLCQIGTTVFRSALASGLPITARRNHSYRVSYYEPAGTDATIYDPAPDLKFINDTGNHILIQARIEGNNLYFDFWGTKDERGVEQTKPVIYNIVKPGPTKIIETLDLKPGEKKCTEKPHNGADAYFDYKVTYSNSEIKSQRFSSHYVPWQEVCLLGVEKLTEMPAADNAAAATSTIVNATSTQN